MMKSYTFNCDDFILDDQGGTFVRGSRRFSLKLNSPHLSSKIQQHVYAKASFFETEYPDNVMAMLCLNDLLRPSADSNQYASFRYTLAPVRYFFQNTFSGVKRTLETDFLFIFFIVRLRTVFHILSGHQSIILLREPIVNRIVRPWAWMLRPIGVALLATLNTLWLAWNFGENWLSGNRTVWSLDTNSIAVTVSLLSLFILHELAHAASAYGIYGKCGAIRIRRIFFVIPYLSAHLPGIKNGNRVERFAISASGPIFQISSSILLMHIFPQSQSVHYAAVISIFVALMNFIPIKNTDGYWMLVELLKGVAPHWTIRWSTASKLDIVYTIFMSILGSTVLALLALSLSAHTKLN